MMEELIMSLINYMEYLVKELDLGYAKVWFKYKIKSHNAFVLYTENNMSKVNSFNVYKIHKNNDVADLLSKNSYIRTVFSYCFEKSMPSNIDWVVIYEYKRE